MKYVGIDMHLRTCEATVMDGKGRITGHAKFATSEKEIRSFFSGMKKAKVAIEASGFIFPWYDLMREMGHEVKVAHPLKTKLIAEAKIKTDKIDSEALANLLRTDFLPCSYIPDKETRELRAIVRHRAFLVQERTRMKNRIKSELRAKAISPPFAPFTAKGQVFLKSLGMPRINSSLEVLRTLDEQIKECSCGIEEVGRKIPDVELLTSITGVSYYSALLLVSEIGDAKRFCSAEKLASYAGVVPSVRQSGPTVRMGGIKRAGNTWLRWILTQIVWVHVANEKDSFLTAFFNHVAAKRGRKKAVMATSRKLLHVIYAMLRDKKPFSFTRSHGEKGPADCDISLRSERNRHV
jgi:transposase